MTNEDDAVEEVGQWLDDSAASGIEVSPAVVRGLAAGLAGPADDALERSLAEYKATTKGGQVRTAGQQMALDDLLSVLHEQEDEEAAQRDSLGETIRGHYANVHDAYRDTVMGKDSDEDDEDGGEASKPAPFDSAALDRELGFPAGTFQGFANRADAIQALHEDMATFGEGDYRHLLGAATPEQQETMKLLGQRAKREMSRFGDIGREQAIEILHTALGHAAAHAANGIPVPPIEVLVRRILTTAEKSAGPRRAAATAASNIHDLNWDAVYGRNPS
jgi:hypothetical protein